MGVSFSEVKNESKAVLISRGHVWEEVWILQLNSDAWMINFEVKLFQQKKVNNVTQGLKRIVIFEFVANQPKNEIENATYKKLNIY